jgi:hypothetical protein
MFLGQCGGYNCNFQVSGIFTERSRGGARGKLQTHVGYSKISNDRLAGLTCKLHTFTDTRGFSIMILHQAMMEIFRVTDPCYKYTSQLPLTWKCSLQNRIQNR